MDDNTQQEKAAPREAAVRKPSLTLPWLMMLLPIPSFLSDQHRYRAVLLFRQLLATNPDK